MNTPCTPQVSVLAETQPQANVPKETFRAEGPAKRRAILICPSARPKVGFLAERMPLSNVPLLGQSLIEYWLSHLACSGIKEVLILACDRPEEVRALTGSGARWGLTVEVQAAPIELSPSDAVSKYAEEPAVPLDQSAALFTEFPEQPAFQGEEICVAELDHLPGLDKFRMFSSYREWYAAVVAWVPHAKVPDRVGVRELRSGVWVNTQSQILTSDLRAPCWVGKNVFVGERAIIGPGTILEEGSLIEPGAVVASSYIGPDTYVGRDAELLGSLAWGDTLIDWSTGAKTQVQDAFILCSLKRPQPRRQIAALFDHITKFYSYPQADGKWTNEDCRS